MPGTRLRSWPWTVDRFTNGDPTLLPCPFCFLASGPHVGSPGRDTAPAWMSVDDLGAHAGISWQSFVESGWREMTGLDIGWRACDE
jgi:hypothetical protein